MKPTWCAFAVGLCGSLATAQAEAETSAAPAPQSRAESSHYEETSRLADVAEFFAELGRRTPYLRMSSFGRSEEGLPLMLAVLSDPPVASAREAHLLERPIVFVQANIHAGEVEGKEAAQHLARRLLLGDLHDLLVHVVVMIAPNYNADGNEAIDANNRTEQNGPIAGVGRRENVNGLDLNRDYMKLESAEACALVALWNDWDPHIVVDLHTTNGTYHGYHLTYSQPINLSLDARLLDYQQRQLMPALAKALAERHGLRSYAYGNLSGKAPEPGEPEQRTWDAFDHRPRLGQNYVGLRNRIAILSEAYSYLDYASRIAATEAFVEEILHYAAAHAAEIRGLCRTLDLEFVSRAIGPEACMLGVEYEPLRSSDPVQILLAPVVDQLNPRNGKTMKAVVAGEISSVLVHEQAFFKPTRAVAMAKLYVLPRKESLRPSVHKLLQHGVLVEELSAPMVVDMQSFVVDSWTQAPRAFQGHKGVRITGHEQNASCELPAGTIVVRLAQPLGRLAAYLLEPESDDGLVFWNYFDQELAQGKPLPVGKVMTNVSLAARRFEDY